MGNISGGVCLGLLLLAGSLFGEVFTSPDGRVTADVAARDEGLVAAVAYDGKPLAALSLGGPVLAEPFTGGLAIEKMETAAAATTWKPVWGDRAEVRDAWRGGIYTLREKGGLKRTLRVEVRVYGEGVAARYTLPTRAETVVDENTFVTYPAGSAAWAIAHTEATFPADAMPIDALHGRWMMPLTVEVPGAGVCSFLEAHCVGYPRALAEGRGKTDVKVALQGRSTPVSRGFQSPWRALVTAPNAARLIEHATLVPNLNPPCALADTSWIVPGLTVSNEGNCPIKMDELLKVGERAATAHFKYLQIDWGWYGTEWTWTDKDRETFLKTNPDWKDDPDWARNSYANPRVAAKGRVGYRPDWKGGTTVDLDIPALISFLKAKGMGLCLYLHGQVIEANDMDELFALYARWGVAGLKPGFVRYGDAASTDWNRRLVETAARHRLWLCVHDAHVPDGMERTYPNLMLCEGGGGQEGNHPVRQDVCLPFTRCLAGPFDYTPMFFDKGKTHAHAVAFLLVYPGPSAVVRGRTQTYLSDASGADVLGSERAFMKQLPMTYDETRVLDAQIGRHLVVARRKGRTWYLAGMTGAAAVTTTLDFAFLPSNVPATLTLWKDDPSAGAGRVCGTVQETRTVACHDKVVVPMAAAGGFVATVQLP